MAPKDRREFPEDDPNAWKNANDGREADEDRGDDPDDTFGSGPEDDAFSRAPFKEEPPAPGDEDVPVGLRRFFGGNARQSMKYMDAAYTLVGGLLILGLGGWLIDRQFGTAPAGVLLGLLAGGIVGFTRLGRIMLTRP